MEQSILICVYRRSHRFHGNKELKICVHIFVLKTKTRTKILRTESHRFLVVQANKDSRQRFDLLRLALQTSIATRICKQLEIIPPFQVKRSSKLMSINTKCFVSMCSTHDLVLQSDIRVLILYFFCFSLTQKFSKVLQAAGEKHAQKNVLGRAEHERKALLH